MLCGRLWTRDVVRVQTDSLLSTVPCLAAALFECDPVSLDLTLFDSSQARVDCEVSGVGHGELAADNYHKIIEDGTNISFFFCGSSLMNGDCSFFFFFFFFSTSFAELDSSIVRGGGCTHYNACRSC